MHREYLTLKNNHKILLVHKAHINIALLVLQM